MTSAPQIILYPGRKGRPDFSLRVDGGTVWLTQAETDELFQTTTPNINIHIRHAFTESELGEASVVKEPLITQADGKSGRTQTIGGPDFADNATTDGNRELLYQLLHIPQRFSSIKTNPSNSSNGSRARNARLYPPQTISVIPPIWSAPILENPHRAVHRHPTTLSFAAPKGGGEHSPGMSNAIPWVPAPPQIKHPNGVQEHATMPPRSTHPIHHIKPSAKPAGEEVGG